jgi:hypothetical protein
MRARSASFRLLLAALAVPLFASSAGAAGAWSVGKGEWFSTIEGSVFSAPTFHDSDGVRLNAPFTTEQRALRATTEIGWKDRISVLISLPAMSVTRHDRANRAAATATGLQDLMLGLRYALARGGAGATVQLDYTAPLGYNRTLDSLGLRLGEGVGFTDANRYVHVNDGLQQLALRAHLGAGFANRVFLQASAGYATRYHSFGKRDEGPVAAGEPRPGKWIWADQLQTGADLGVWIAGPWLLGGRYRGVTTVSNGPLVPEIAQHLAGPVLLYRLDDGLDMIAGSWSTASGRNVLHYDQIYVGVAFRQSKLNRLQGFSGTTRAP